MTLTSMTLQPANRRLSAAISFAAIGLLTTAVFFHKLSWAANVIVLYIVLPSVSLGVAGYIWGGAILDSAKVKSYGDSLLRGLGVSAGAYVIFALLYACGLPLLETGWTLRQAGGLFLLTLTLGLLLGGPLAAMTGMIAATSLFGFRHYLSRGRDRKKSETSNRC